MINWDEVPKSVNCVLITTNKNFLLMKDACFLKDIPNAVMIGVSKPKNGVFYIISDSYLSSFAVDGSDIFYDRPAVKSNPEPDNYSTLRNVLDRAFEQASSGKGQERHGQNLPFDKQPMQQIQDLVGEGFALGQAIKKMQESQRLSHDAAIRELLGAINYIAGVIIHKEREL